ncbi:peptidylprolyl isomerase [Candidatus Kaiserbacteria bacterium]|nr:peptidylprolyl isomerase [Candidatus Kaiserbacteria bacterium]
MAEKTATHNPTVTLHTSHGDIVLELYADVMPITVGNFLALAEKDFYDNTKFHRVIDGFMIQGGDPNSKTDKAETYGTGGPGYAIKDEFVSDPRLTNVRGTIAMANAGPETGGSQFFINLVDNTGLDFDKPPETSSHPVFGKVIAGLDVVDKIAKVPTNSRDLPLEPVVVQDVAVAK